MNFVAYSLTEFGSVISDLKALDPCLEKIGNTNKLQKEKLDLKFL